jgi:hypothetical protein
MTLDKSCFVTTLLFASLAGSACNRFTQEPGKAAKMAGPSALQRAHETAKPWDD